MNTGPLGRCDVKCVGWSFPKRLDLTFSPAFLARRSPALGQADNDRGGIIWRGNFQMATVGVDLVRPENAIDLGQGD